MTPASMVRARKERRWLIGSALFIAFVIVTGVAFSAIELTDDPFVNMSDISAMREMLAETAQADGGTLLQPAEQGETVSGAQRAPSITAMTVVEVLYDLWYFCAATAIAIVISYLIKLAQRVKQTLGDRRGASSDARQL